MHHFPMQVLGRCQTFRNSLWSASFAFEVLCIHILKCESYFMALVCIKFYFIEAKLTFFNTCWPKEFLWGLWQFCLWFNKQLHASFILNKCIKYFRGVLRMHLSALMNQWCLIVMLLHIFKQNLVDFFKQTFKKLK